MSRNWLLAHWRRAAMQATLCAVLAATVGLAALVTHAKRAALRVPLNREQGVGRLRVALPKNWSAPEVSDQLSAGDSVSVTESLPDNLPGRRLFIERSRTGRMISPLEHLVRAGYVPERELAGATDTTTSAATPDAVTRVQPIDVAAWPGVLVTRVIPASGTRRAQKHVLACATLPPGQAVVIRLEGPGVLDDADEVLVRQMAETVRVRTQAGDRQLLEPSTTGASSIDLGDGVYASAPDHYDLMPPELNRTSRDLIADGAVGNWVGVELIPCLWFPPSASATPAAPATSSSDDTTDPAPAAAANDAAAEQQLLTMLAAHDRDWRSGRVRKLGDNMWAVDRLDSAQSFPSRAYCFTNGDDQALCAVMRGSWRSDRGFDDAWRAIYASVRFTSHKDLARLLAAGADEAKRIRDAGVDQLVRPPAAHQVWSLWDQSENVDKQPWMQIDWGLTSAQPWPQSWTANVAATTAPTTAPAAPVDAANLWHGSRQTWPDRLKASAAAAWIGPYAADGAAEEAVKQVWSGTADLTHYLTATDRFTVEHGQTRQLAAVQRWELQDGRLRNLLTADPPAPAPDQYVPGAWLPLLMSQVAATGQPMVLRTESFLACDGAAPPALMYLYVAPVPDQPMPCVAVTVNGTGRVTRFWYATDGSLRYVDFAGNLRAQRN